MNALAEYLEKIPFYKEIIWISMDFEEGTSFNEIKEFYDGYLNLERLFDLVTEKGINVFCESYEECGKLGGLIEEYYKKVQEDFFSMSKSVLGKYFE